MAYRVIRKGLAVAMGWTRIEDDLRHNNVYGIPPRWAEAWKGTSMRKSIPDPLNWDPDAMALIEWLMQHPGMEKMSLGFFDDHVEGCASKKNGEEIRACVGREEEPTVEGRYRRALVDLAWRYLGSYNEEPPRSKGWGAKMKRPVTDWANPDDAIIIASPMGSGGYGLTVVKNGVEYSFLSRFSSREETREWAEDWLKGGYADRVEEVTPCRSCGEPYSLGDTGLCFDCTVNN